jgi:hypothetical protein
MFNPSARDVVNFGSDFIPGVSETKDIISLGTNVGKGNYIGAGIDATALALGAVPVLGDIARKGFKSLFAQDVKNATELLKDTKLIDKWKKDNPNPKPQKRNPDVQKAANELLDGKITGKQYRSVVKENMPIKKIEEVPEVPTFTEIVGSLTSDKSKKGIIGLNKEVKDGTRVASRLDIPAYEQLHLTNQLINLVDEGYDLAIRLGKLEDSTMIAQRLSSRTHYVCASPDYLARFGVPHSLSELSKHNCLQGTLPYWRFQEAGKVNNIEVNGNIRCNSGRALVDAALKGLGIVQLPDYYVLASIESGQLISLLEQHRESNEGVWALYPHNRHLSPKIRLLIDYIC